MVSTLALARNGVAGFFDWWLCELRALVPQRLRRAGRHDRARLTVALDDEGLTLLESASGGERVLAQAPRDAPERLRGALRRAPRRRRGVVLRLGRELGLRKTLELPLAAREDLDQLLRFEMDRLTPFPAEEVCFAHRILSADAENRRLSVELQVAPRTVVEQALRAAERLGLRARRVELGGLAEPAEDALDLLPDHGPESARTSRLNRALVVLAVVLAAAAVAIPLHKQRLRATDLEQQVSAARVDAERSLALRTQLDEITATAHFVVDRKSEAPMAAHVLAELTRLIPDQAYVDHLYLRDAEVQMQGFAQTASDLIGLLEQSPLFEAPQFRSPVTRDSRSDLERFHISVELAAMED